MALFLVWSTRQGDNTQDTQILECVTGAFFISINKENLSSNRRKVKQEKRYSVYSGSYIH